MTGVLQHVAFSSHLFYPGEGNISTIHNSGGVSSVSGFVGCEIVTVTGGVPVDARTYRDGGGAISWTSSFADLLQNYDLTPGDVFGLSYYYDMDENTCASGDSTVLGRPTASGSFIIGTLPVADLPSETVNELVCGWDYGEGANFATNSVAWTDICLTDGAVDDGQTAHVDDAFDTIGTVWLYGEGWYYAVTDADYSDDAGVLTLNDDDIDIPGRDDNVDVTVTVTMIGSFVTWNVNVFEAGTSTPAAVDVSLEGDLGSDEDTTWTQTDSGGLDFDRWPTGV